MPRQLSLALASVLAIFALLPVAGASARTNVRVGIGDQQVSMFDNANFKRLGIKRVRYFVRWNAVDNRGELGLARAYADRARASGISVFVHISTNDLRLKKAKLPSVAQYRSKVGRLVRDLRKHGVTEFGTWNEANHASQPTYRSPKRAAQFFTALYNIVKPSCRSCTVVALDVLDQAGVERYIGSFYRSLSRSWRRRAAIVGIHNYGDVNRRRTTFTSSIIRTVRSFNRSTKFWFTETGGIVNFGRSWPFSTSRAASRLKGVFSLARRFRSSGVQRVYVYNWTGARRGARFDAGITNPNGTPRPAYNVLRAQLRGFLR
jgi:putative glycosyl hydrolase